MPRIARFVFDNSYFHILSRGNNRQNVFIDEKDFKKFLELMKQSVQKFHWKFHHFVLMNNHYHIILFNEIARNLSEGFKWLNLLYAQYFRKKYGGCGHLWQDRFKSFVIQGGIYLLECGRYVELNSFRAGIVKNPENYPWSSYQFYTKGKYSDFLLSSPEYEGLSDRQIERQKLYIDFIKDGICEKRNLERCFRQGFYGDNEFGKWLSAKGLKERGWKRGAGSVVYRKH